MGAKNNEVANTFAQWVSKTHYNVTFDPTVNGNIKSGNGVVDRYEGQMITSADVPTCVGKDHYLFKSWNPAFVDHAVTKHEKYTAVLEYVAATVHFNTGENGEKVNDVIVDRGSTITSVPKPRHKSGIFVGWCSDSGLQNLVDFKTWKMPSPAVETTFYAKWDLNAAKATVSFIVTGGTAKHPTVVKVLQKDGWADINGSAVLTAEDIIVTASDGYDPNKITWTPSTPTAGTVITGDITYSAVFEKFPFFNIVVSLGNNLKFIQGSANMNQIQGGSTVTIEVGPASIIYGFGETEEERNVWLRKIVIDPQSGFTTQIKKQSHAAPSPVSFDTGKSVKLSDSLIITGKLQNNTSISIPDAIEIPLTINFIDPGNGGTGVATLNPDTYRVDNSNIGRRIVTSRKVYRTKGTFTSDIFEQNADKTYVYPLDENGLIVGFQKVTGMTVLPLYEDIGIENDHNEKFSLDLSSHYGSDTLDIVCDMLRLDYLLPTGSYIDSLISREAYDVFQTLNVGIKDSNSSSVNHVNMDNIPKRLIFRHNGNDIFNRIQVFYDKMNKLNINTLKIHNDFLRYCVVSGNTFNIRLICERSSSSLNLSIDFNDMLNIWKYQTGSYKTVGGFSSEILDKFYIKNITYDMVLKLIGYFKRMIKNAETISRLIDVDEENIEIGYRPRTIFEDALSNKEVSLIHVYDEAKNIKNFALPFKYNYFTYNTDMLKHNTKIHSLESAFQFIDFHNTPVPDIFKNKKIDNLQHMFRCAFNGIMKADSVTVNIHKNMSVDNPFYCWIVRSFDMFVLVEKCSMIIEKDALSLTYDDTLTDSDFKKLNFSLGHLFHGFNNTNGSSCKLLNVIKDMSNIDMGFSVINMLTASCISNDQFSEFMNYSMNKLPIIKAISEFASYSTNLTTIPRDFLSRVDKNIRSISSFMGDSGVTVIDDDLLDLFPNVNRTSYAFRYTTVKHVPDWWNRYSDRITNSTDTFEDVVSHNMYHVPVSWGGYEIFDRSGITMLEVSTNNEITIANGKMRLTVHVNLVDDRVTNVLKEDMLILDELLIVPKANNYGLVFTKETPTFTESTKTVNYPILITYTTEPPANTVIEYTFDWRKEHHDLSSTVPSKSKHDGSTNDPGSSESPGSGILERGMSIPITDENFVSIPLSGLVDEHGNKYPDFTLRFKLVKKDFENKANTFWDGYIELPDGVLEAIRKARVSPNSADEFYLSVMISYYRSDIDNNQEPIHLIRESKFDLSANNTINIINSVLGTPGESYDKMNIRITDVIITNEW